ncbi:Alkyl hydroperoxide reductase AhpD [Thalassoglobus neptunius]|uniref:Alkyl hydroperoxide reductase AhpD n=1 Tax=Thalassoglobus neptunius TaxID=1938619 RepID=A0A5C5X5J8_9PLAN|nr:carboxymuconolactone decarboxylase family protein [Thalassoglobus neptunius]TWT57292.1 Alkyl hydroperoxide reductase AhpD [Thalassoglobus neptunius]
MSGERINYYQHLGDTVVHLSKVESILADGHLGAELLELVKLRVSQINGCSFCVNYHTQVLRLLGTSDQRIDLAVVWEESSCFTKEERAAFRWAEAVTKVADTRFINDQIFEEAQQVFGDAALCELTLSIGMINIWNRMAIAFHSDHAMIDQLLAKKRSERNV